MAACGSLQHIFEKPLPENPTLLESLSSWNQIKPVKPMEQSSFTEIFGELHFKDNSQSSSPSSLPAAFSSFPISSFSSPSSPFLDLKPQTGITRLEKNGSFGDKCDDNESQSILDSFSSTAKTSYAGCHKNVDSFSPMNYESLQLCTEGLGFESSDDVEDLKNDVNERIGQQYQEEKGKITRRSTSENLSSEFRRSRSGGGAFPPPISCIGKSGKPRVSFKSYRHDGRFVLKEVKVPTSEFLHACREDGRLKLHFVHPNDEMEDEEVEENYVDDAQEEYEEEQGKNDDDG